MHVGNNEFGCKLSMRTSFNALTSVPFFRLLCATFAWYCFWMYNVYSNRKNDYFLKNERSKILIKADVVMIN